MKKMLMVSNGEHLAARSLKTTFALLIGLALGTAFWVASTSAAPEGMSPTKMIESHLPAGKTTANASKADYLAAVCGAVKQFKASAGAIVRAAVTAHPQWKNDILRAAFNCVGTDDCRLLRAMLRGAIEGSPGSASDLTQLAVELAPACASSFGGGEPGGEGEGVFGNAPGTNLNPPPGAIGGGGQGTIVAVCFHNQTLFVTPERAQELVSQGARLGACQVTPTANP
jgi:hypothetical protein